MILNKIKEKKKRVAQDSGKVGELMKIRVTEACGKNKQGVAFIEKRIRKTFRGLLGRYGNLGSNERVTRHTGDK